jgi:methylmalonyl-CoA mutase
MAEELKFDEFPIPTYDEWYDTAVKSLKGADFDKKLTTRTVEAITLQPLYLKADAAHQHTLPGDFPYVRGTQAAPRTWDIAQALPLPTPQDFNTAAQADLARGQTAITLVLDVAARAGNDPDADPEAVGRGGVSIAVQDDLKAALQGVDLKTTPLYVDAGLASPAVMALLGTMTDADLRGGVLYDPLAVLEIGRAHV